MHQLPLCDQLTLFAQIGSPYAYAKKRTALGYERAEFDMRLICPNCDAQYEVPADVMPAEGRDVQCSNCGQTWFQDHPDALVSRQASWHEDELEDEEVIRVDEEPEYEEEYEAEPEYHAEPDPVADVPTFEPEPEPEPEPKAWPRRDLDPAVADVLREEAELEQRARRSEAASMESQPDLGLTENTEEADKRAREARDRMARMRGEAAPSAEAPSSSDAGRTAATAAALASRRDLLPDIEEINSTLRSNSARSPGTDPGQTAQIEVKEKRSSRRGFILTVALVAILALIYSYAPQLADAVPALEPALTGYVSMIDSWRVWLDTQISSLLSWLDAAAATSNG